MKAALDYICRQRDNESHVPVSPADDHDEDIRTTVEDLITICSYQPISKVSCNSQGKFNAITTVEIGYFALNCLAVSVLFLFHLHSGA